MPHTPLRPCRHPDCSGFCKPGQVYCPQHATQFSTDARRGSAAFRGYDSRWRAARKAYLQLHPLCTYCMKEGIIAPATVVDHVVPHRGDPRLFWDERNWQPLCKDCHDSKTGSGL